MVSPDERHGDAEESRAAGEPIFIVVFVAKDVVDAANSGDDARKSERAQPDASDADSSVLGGVGLQSNSAQLISAARAEQVEPDGNGNGYGDEQGQIGGGAVKCGIDIGESRKNSGLDLGGVQSLRHLPKPRDEPVV